MASVRQTIVEALAAKLEAITTANGYNFEVGSDRVFRSAENPTMIPTPAVVLIQGEENIEQNYNNLYACTLEIVVGFVDNYSGSDPETQANLFLADIQKAMGVEFCIAITNSAGAASETTVIMLEEGNTITISEALPGFLIGQVNYEVQYRRNMLDPNKV
jgi:hypothetical protein